MEGEEGGALESVLLGVGVSNVLDDSLERKLSDEEIGSLLVLLDLSKGDGTWSVLVWLLNTTSLDGALSGGFGGH